MNDIITVGQHRRTFNVSPHFHENWELIYCTSGNGRMVFENCEPMPYSEGELVIIPPLLRHSNMSAEGFTNIHLTVSDPLFSRSSAVKISDDNDRHIYSAFTQVVYYYNSDIHNKDLVISALGDLIAAYITVFGNRPKYSETVEMIRRDILSNLSDSSYQIDEFLKTIPLNYDYLRKLFKKETGFTPHSYLTSMRMQAASRLLSAAGTGEYNISEIADMCGYYDPLYFSRVFKKYFGASPTKHKP